jgi:DNA-binding NtrC family response regulator
MNKKNILVVASQDATNPDLLNWYVNTEQYNLTLAGSDERAIELVQQGSFDLVLADSTDQSIDVKKLGAVLPILDQELQLISYSGESVDLLDEKIHTVFEQKKAERVQRLLILDSSRQPFWQNWIPFSAN